MHLYANRFAPPLLLALVGVASSCFVQSPDKFSKAVIVASAPAIRMLYIYIYVYMCSRVDSAALISLYY